MKYGFIGCGNMGSAIAKALSTKVNDIMVSDRSGKAAALGFAYGSAETVAQSCDALFLAVKPHLMKGMLSPLQPILAEKKPLLITMAAGLEIAQIQAFAGCDLPIIRIMPNTPVALGKGMIQYCRNSLVADDILADWLKDMADCGRLDPLEERLIDAASALSGSGPAYMYVLMEALADGAVACGIPRAKAMEYAAMTMVGAGEIYLATKQHPGALKDAVCSPGGSTIQGVRTLENHAFRGAVMEAVITAAGASGALGKK